MNNNATLYLKLLQELVTEYAECASDIQQQLGESAQVIEEQIKAKRAVTKEQVGTLRAAFATLADSVSQVSGGLVADASAGTINRQETLKLVQEIQQLIVNSDAHALDLLQQLLSKVEMDSKLAEDLGAVKDLLEVYNFADVALRLNEAEAFFGDQS